MKYILKLLKLMRLKSQIVQVNIDKANRKLDIREIKSNENHRKCHFPLNCAFI